MYIIYKDSLIKTSEGGTKNVGAERENVENNKRQFGSKKFVSL